MKNIHYRFPSHGGFPIGKMKNHLKQKPVLLLDFSFTIQLLGVLGYPHDLGNPQALEAPPAGRSISSDSPSSTARRGPPQRARRPGGNNLGLACGAAGDEQNHQLLGGFEDLFMGFHWLGFYGIVYGIALDFMWFGNSKISSSLAP